MRTLNRLLLLLLSAVLLTAVYLIYSGMTEVSIGHETYYKLKWPWLHEVREACLFSVLGWCFLFLRRDPTFARAGLAAVILAFVLMNLPLNHASLFHIPPSWR